MKRPQWLDGLSDTQLLGLCIWSESSGDPVRGKLAVGWVVMNRVGNPAFGMTVRDVILKPDQFSWFNDPPKQIELTYGVSTAIADLVLQYATRDPTKSATHFHSAQFKPYWVEALHFTVQIGQNLFYR